MQRNLGGVGLEACVKGHWESPGSSPCGTYKALQKNRKARFSARPDSLIESFSFS
jgi:hypothetical protein